MDQIALLDHLESGGPISRPNVGNDFGEKYFERLLGYFGSDNEKLLALGSHWRKLLAPTDHSPWVYRAGGIYERSLGNWQASANAFVAAGDHSLDPQHRVSFKVGAIDSLGRAGKLKESQDLAKALHRRLKVLGNPGLAARAMLNLGNVLVYQDRMTEARKVLKKAERELAFAGLDLEAASAKLGLSSTHLFGGNPRTAEKLANDVEELAKSLDAEYLADLARLNLALVFVVTGRSDQAYELLSHLKQSLESSAVDSARVSEYLADAFFQLNLWSEAEEAYREVKSLPTKLTPLHDANINLGLGQSLLALGRHNDATPHLLSAEKLYAKLNNRAWQAVCLRLLAIADFEAGKTKKAIVKLHQAAKFASDSPFHLCQILLSLSQFGENHIDSAYRLIKRHGYLDLEWQVHYLRACKAIKPGIHYRKMFKSILVGRMATRSVAARLGFLKDKEAALRAFLGWLLSQPSGEKVKEAKSVIEQIRSATLLDEILRQESVPSAVKDVFRKLQIEIGSGFDTAPTGHARLQPSGVVSMSRAQKAVTDGLMTLNVTSWSSHSEQSESVILAETNSGLRILHGDKVSNPLLSDAEIQKILRWLPFELLAPMTDRNVNPDAALNLLKKLSNAFPMVWESQHRLICPDGMAWRIPWSLCGLLAGKSEEYGIAMHPRMTSSFSGGLSPKSRAVVWLGLAKDLPFAEKEAEAIAGNFQCCPIITNAKEARGSLDGEYDAIHVVSHAIHRPTNPMLSTIEFPDGPIFATEIARSNLKVRLATLSACETGSISLQSKSEPDGLARAFIARGAQSTVASLWPLDDEAAFRQFKSLYEAVLKDHHINSALFHSRCICREWNAHPYFWGALALYSGYPQ